MRIVLDVEVLEKSDIRPTCGAEISRSRRIVFSIYTLKYGELFCYNRRLYDRIEEGEHYRFIYQDVNKRVIGIEGDGVDEEEWYQTKETAPLNVPEAALHQQLTSEGWDVTKRGFPDFACFKDGRFIVVEVKPKRSHRLKARQRQVMETLAGFGIECYRWSPDTGFERILPKQDKL